MFPIASSNANLAILQAFDGSFITSQQNTEKLSARPNLIGWVCFRSFSALAEAVLQAQKAEFLACSQASATETSEMYLKQSPFILQQNTWLSTAFVDPGINTCSKSSTMSLQTLINSAYIFFLYSLMNSTRLVKPLFSSFFSRDSRTLQADLLPPIEFLYATERRFLSSTDRSVPKWTTFFMKSNMSSYLSLCSAILAMQTSSSLVDMQKVGMIILSQPEFIVLARLKNITGSNLKIFKYRHQDDFLFDCFLNFQHLFLQIQ